MSIYLIFHFFLSQSKQNQSKHILDKNLIEMIFRIEVSLMVGFLRSDVKKQQSETCFLHRCLTSHVCLWCRVTDGYSNDDDSQYQQAADNNIRFSQSIVIAPNLSLVFISTHVLFCIHSSNYDIVILVNLIFRCQNKLQLPGL